MMNLVVETVVVLFNVFVDILVSGYNNLFPVSWRKKNISGQTVVITGAASGLGRLLSLRFAKLRCPVALIDVASSVNDVAKECAALGSPNAMGFVCDLSSRKQIYDTGKHIKESFGVIDILINNAGIVTGKKFLDCDDTMIEKTMAVNVHAHFWLAKVFLPGMLSRNKGHLVTIASGAGNVAVNGLADYCASKFAAVGFDESLRNEILVSNKTGVHTTCVCPFYINTGMFEGVTTRFPALLPILEPDYVVDKIMQAIVTNQHVLILPKMLILTNILKHVLPTSAGFRLLEFFGVTSSMDTFVGRQKKL